MTAINANDRADLERFARKIFIVGEVALWVGLAIIYATRPGVGPIAARAEAGEAADAFVARFVAHMSSLGGKS